MAYKPAQYKPHLRNRVKNRSVPAVPPESDSDPMAQESNNESQQLERDLPMSDVISTGEKTILANGYGDDCRRGLTGADAAFLGAHFTAAADRDVLDAVRDGQRHIVDVVHTTAKAGELATEKVGAANALAIATGELRLSKELLKESCETRAVVVADGQKTRDLINDIEQRRQAERIAEQNAQIIQLRLQLGQPV